jgi:hypothetical protein
MSFVLLNLCILGSIYEDHCLSFCLGRWFSPGTPVSSTNKTNRHDITEILLKVALNTITNPFKKYVLLAEEQQIILT